MSAVISQETRPQRSAGLCQLFGKKYNRKLKASIFTSTEITRI